MKLIKMEATEASELIVTTLKKDNEMGGTPEHKDKNDGDV